MRAGTPRDSNKIEGERETSRLVESRGPSAFGLSAVGEPPPSEQRRLPSVRELQKVRLRSAGRGRPSRHDPNGPPTSRMHEMITDIDNNTQNYVILEREWRAVQLRCQTHPDEAAVLDRRGRTCLHAVCAKKPPVSVVNAMLIACGGDRCRRNENQDQKSGGYDSILERDKHGRTCLAIAISSNASLEVISRLLERCSRAAGVVDHAGNLPLHLACSGYDEGKFNLVRLLLETFPAAAGRESNNGRTPLHCAIEGDDASDVVQILVQYCPESVVMDGCGLNPLFMAIQQKSSAGVIRNLVEGRPDCTLTKDRCDGSPLRRAIEMQATAEVLQFLCKPPSVVLQVDDYVGNTALHSALEYGVPREAVVKKCVSVAPEIATMESKCGQTPLTLACQQFIRGRQNRQHNRNLWNCIQILLRAAKYGRVADVPTDEDPVLHPSVSMALPWEVTELALETYPEQVSMRDPISNNYPLILALQSSSQKAKSAKVMAVLEAWPEAATRPSAPHGRTALSIAAEERSLTPEVYRNLVRCHPSALRSVDPLLGLHPFQIAALPKSMPHHPPTRGKTRRIFAQWDGDIPQPDLLHLSAVFELLVAAPELVRVGFR